VSPCQGENCRFSRSDGVSPPPERWKGGRVCAGWRGPRPPSPRDAASPPPLPPSGLRPQSETVFSGGQGGSFRAPSLRSGRRQLAACQARLRCGSFQGGSARVLSGPPRRVRAPAPRGDTVPPEGREKRPEEPPEGVCGPAREALRVVARAAGPWSALLGGARLRAPAALRLPPPLPLPRRPAAAAAVAPPSPCRCAPGAAAPSSPPRALAARSGSGAAAAPPGLVACVAGLPGRPRPRSPCPCAPAPVALVLPRGLARLAAGCCVGAGRRNQGGRHPCGVPRN